MKKAITLAAVLFLAPVIAFAHCCPPAPVAPAGGGGLVYGSGPMAPGWNVSLPGGGVGSSENYTPYQKTLPDGSQCEFYSGCMTN